MEFWGYKNEVRRRSVSEDGLTENQDFGNPRRRVLNAIAAVSTAKCKIWVYLCGQECCKRLLSGLHLEPLSDAISDRTG